MTGSIIKGQFSRFEELTNNAEKTMDIICANVSCNGSLIDLCDIWKVNYGHMTRWIRKDKARSLAYNQAMDDRVEWCRDRITQEFERIGFADIRSMFDESGDVKEPKDWPTEISAIIKNFDITYDQDGNKKIKVQFWDKTKSLELLGKNINMFVSKIEHSIHKTLEDLINESREGED